MIDSVGRSHGCPTGKRKFFSRREAKRWARSRNTLAGSLVRAYRCFECGAWHVTTQSTGKTTFYREVNDDR